MSAGVPNDRNGLRVRFRPSPRQKTGADPMSSLSPISPPSDEPVAEPAAGIGRPHTGPFAHAAARLRRSWVIRSTPDVVDRPPRRSPRPFSFILGQQDAVDISDQPSKRASYPSPSSMQAFIARARPSNSQDAPRATSSDDPQKSQLEKRRGGAQRGDGPAAAPSPSAFAEPGLFDRLLRRAKSGKKASKALSGNSPADDSFVALTDDGADSEPEDAGHAPLLRPMAAAHERPKTAPSRATPCDSVARQPLKPREPLKPLKPQQPTAATAATAASSTPGLKRKPSLMDRLRFRSASIPPQEPQRPRTVYVPTHAASDFSRMKVSPRQRSGCDEDSRRPMKLEPLAPIASHPGDDDTEKDVDALSKDVKAPSPTTTKVPQVESQPSRRKSLSRQDDTEARRRSHRSEEEPESKRKSDPQHQPEVPPSQSEPAEAIEPQLATTTATKTAAAPSPSAPADTTQALHDSDSDLEETAELPSDFQQFLARAEAEERAQRIQVWRSLSTASRHPAPPHPHLGAPPTRNYSPPALHEIPEAVPGDFSPGGTTAVQARSARRAGHPKRATWDSGVSAGYVLNGVGEEGGGYVGAAAGVDYAATQPRGLRRQTSLAKKVVEYIKPSRAGEEVGGHKSVRGRGISR